MTEPSKKALFWANAICEFLMDLSAKDLARWRAVEERSHEPYPFAALAYGAALADWNDHGRPPESWYSTAQGQKEDPYLLEYAVELSAHFGLRVMNCEDGMAEEKKVRKPVLRHRVEDWGPN
jgi:hypothetical protein